MEGQDRLREIYDAHASDVMRLAYVLTGHRETSEDLTQEAFVRLARKVLALKDLEHAHAYLLRTVINLARSRGRRFTSERRALQRLSPPREGTLPDPVQQDEMWQRLLSLPKRQGAALFLRYYLDQSEAQAAEVLQCSPSAIKSLVSRGLTALRTASVVEEE